MIVRGVDEQPITLREYLGDNPDARKNFIKTLMKSMSTTDGLQAARPRENNTLADWIIDDFEVRQKLTGKVDKQATREKVDDYVDRLSYVAIDNFLKRFCSKEQLDALLPRVSDFSDKLSVADGYRDTRKNADEDLPPAEKRFDDEPEKKQELSIGQFFLLDKKEGGANDPGPCGGQYGGFVLGNDGELKFQRFMIKRATDKVKKKERLDEEKGQEFNKRTNNRELVSGIMAVGVLNRMIGNVAAPGFEVMALAADWDSEFKEEEKVPYVVSIYFDQFESLYEATGAKAKSIIGGRKMVLQKHHHETIIDWFNDISEPNDEKNEVSESRNKCLNDLGKNIAANLIVGNYQFHTDNLGKAVINGELRIVSLDYDGAFRRGFEKTTAFHSKEKQELFSSDVDLYNQANRKHRKDYFDIHIPNEIRLSADFIDGFEEAAKKEIHVYDISTDLFHAYELSGYNGVIEFIEGLAPGEFTENYFPDSGDIESDLQAVSIKLHSALISRQKSLRIRALELKIAHALGGYEGAVGEPKECAYSWIDLRIEYNKFVGSDKDKQKIFLKNLTFLGVNILDAQENLNFSSQDPTLTLFHKKAQDFKRRFKDGFDETSFYEMMKCYTDLNNDDSLGQADGFFDSENSLTDVQLLKLYEFSISKDDLEAFNKKIKDILLDRFSKDNYGKFISQIVSRELRSDNLYFDDIFKYLKDAESANSLDDIEEKANLIHYLSQVNVEIDDEKLGIQELGWSANTYMDNFDNAREFVNENVGRIIQKLDDSLGRLKDFVLYANEVDHSFQDFFREINELIEFLQNIEDRCFHEYQVIEAKEYLESLELVIDTFNDVLYNHESLYVADGAAAISVLSEFKIPPQQIQKNSVHKQELVESVEGILSSKEKLIDSLSGVADDLKSISFGDEIEHLGLEAQPQKPDITMKRENDFQQLNIVREKQSKFGCFAGLFGQPSVVEIPDDSPEPEVNVTEINLSEFGIDDLFGQIMEADDVKFCATEDFLQVEGGLEDSINLADVEYNSFVLLKKLRNQQDALGNSDHASHVGAVANKLADFLKNKIQDLGIPRFEKNSLGLMVEELDERGSDYNAAIAEDRNRLNLTNHHCNGDKVILSSAWVASNDVDAPPLISSSDTHHVVDDDELQNNNAVYTKPVDSLTVTVKMHIDQNITPYADLTGSSVGEDVLDNLELAIKLVEDFRAILGEDDLDRAMLLRRGAVMNDDLVTAIRAYSKFKNYLEPIVLQGCLLRPYNDEACSEKFTKFSGALDSQQDELSSRVGIFIYKDEDNIYSITQDLNGVIDQAKNFVCDVNDSEEVEAVMKYPGRGP